MSVDELGGVKLSRAHNIMALFHFDHSGEGTINYKEFAAMLKELKRVEKDVRKKLKTHALTPTKTTTTYDAEGSSATSTADGNVSMFTRYDGANNAGPPSPALGASAAAMGSPPHGAASQLAVDDDDDAFEELVMQEILKKMRLFLQNTLRDEEGRERMSNWLFRLADVDRSGRITMTELQQFLNVLSADGIIAPHNFLFEKKDRRALTQELQGEDAVKVMEEYDTGCTGFLTRDEFHVLSQLVVRAYARSIASSGGVDKGLLSQSVGSYRITRRLGKGSSGTVWRGEHRMTGEPMAIKCVPRGNVSDMSRLDVEIKAMTMLRHENVVRLVQVLETAESVFLVQEFCGGGVMFDLVSERKGFGEDLARFYFKQLMDALAYCHEQGVCHRDLRIENIMLDNRGHLKIADFGHAAVFTKGWDIFSTMLVGSMVNLSPEQVDNRVYQGEKVDMWSAGVLLFALLTGNFPFVHASAALLMEKIRTVQYDVPDHVSAEARSLLDCMLVFEPKKRWAARRILDEHPWMRGEVKEPVFQRHQFQINLDVYLVEDIHALYKIICECAAKCDVHTRSEEVGEDDNIIKCLVPSLDLRFAITVSMDESEDPFVEFDMKSGDSATFSRVYKRVKDTVFDYLTTLQSRGIASLSASSTAGSSGSSGALSPTLSSTPPPTGFASPKSMSPVSVRVASPTHLNAGFVPVSESRSFDVHDSPLSSSPTRDRAAFWGKRSKNALSPVRIASSPNALQASPPEPSNVAQRSYARHRARSRSMSGMDEVTAERLRKSIDAAKARQAALHKVREQVRLKKDSM